MHFIYKNNLKWAYFEQYWVHSKAIELTKNDPIDLIFGLWLVIMMFKNPIEPFLKILIFRRFLVRESLKIPRTEPKLPKMAQKLEIFVFTKSL